MKIKTNIINKILNSFIVLLVAVSIFSYTENNNSKATSLVSLFGTDGYENAGGYIVTVADCTC